MTNLIKVILISSLLLISNINAALISSAADNKCPSVKVKNKTSVWTSSDNDAIEKAKNGCIRHYSKKHCLIVFIKNNTANYSAVCGIR